MIIPETVAVGEADSSVRVDVAVRVTDAVRVALAVRVTVAVRTAVLAWVVTTPLQVLGDHNPR